MLLVKMVIGLKHGSAVLVVVLSLQSSVAASFGRDNGVMSLQASGWCFWGLPSILGSPYVDALTYRFGSVNAANLDVFNAAMSGLARCRFCLAMGCATVRFALSWFVEVGGDVKLDAMLSTATFGQARSCLCLAMGFCHGEVCPRFLVSRVGRCVWGSFDRHHEFLVCFLHCDAFSLDALVVPGTWHRENSDSVGVRAWVLCVWKGNWRCLEHTQ